MGSTSETISALTSPERISGRAARAARQKVVSSAPPAPGLSPESEIQKGRAGEAIASSRHSSKEPVGATKTKSCRTSHRAVASSRAAASTASGSSPWATIAAWQRGWSAQAKPIQQDTSVTPGRCVSAGIRA